MQETRLLEMHSKLGTTLSLESIEEIRVFLLGKGRTTNTARAYASDLREFLRATGEKEIPLTNFEQLALYWLVMTRDKVSPKTTIRRLTSLRTFAQWSGLGSVLGDFIAPKPGKPIPHPIPEGLEGLDRLIEVAKNEEQKALIGLCGFVGLRIGEALDICVCHFDLHNMFLTVRGKGDKTRYVPISDRAWQAVIVAYILAADNDQQLVHYGDRAARNVITRMGERAGLQRPISSHDLRATFGTTAYDHCRDIRVVQELLGHSSTETTQIYTGISVEKLRNAVKF